jgi:hypothetical protein
MLEISFNSTFWLEFSALGFLSKLIGEGHLDRERFGRFLFHGIEASSLMEKVPTSSKANNYAAMLEYLFDLGQADRRRLASSSRDGYWTSIDSICRHYCQSASDQGRYGLRKPRR